MKVKYYDFAEGFVPDDRVKAVLEPSHLHGMELKDFEKELNVLLEERLIPKLNGVKKILLLVDDITRQTPVSWILPSFLNLVNRIGIKDENVTILVATGTHRHMTLSEQVKKYGEEALKRVRVVFHNYKTDVVHIGTTPNGTPVVVNRLVLENDLIIGIGMVVPHRVSGFSGGGKIVQPGISGEETTGQTHWLSAQFEGKDILGKVFNPVRDEIEAVAKAANLSFIINVIPDKSGRPIKVFVGDPIPTFKEAAEFARGIYGVKSPTSKIVLTDSYPADLELWQAAKGIYSGDLILEKDGVIILVTPCPEGVGVEFGELIVKYGYRGYEDVKGLVSSGELTNLIVAAHLVHVGRVIRDKGKGILVSPGIDSETAKRLGFIPASNVDEALKIAQSLVGPQEIVVCKFGGELLPLVN
ncbi:MAG: nickel-dependent lactate racemase [Synergistetes bacterium]|nr:nickel-dependent lactate racemase [Synergistota bacterium]MDW8192856.1 nickel-dependent lactate racemase [Synergistota bacterium]